MRHNITLIQRLSHKLVLLLCLILIGFGIMGCQSNIAYASPSSSSRFSNSDDYQIQYRELMDSIHLYHMPPRALQSDLDQHPKISQYNDIDSSPAAYGLNACGLVAAAAATRDRNWTELVDAIGRVAGNDYHANSGIQPTPYVKALRNARIFGPENVAANDAWTLAELYREVLAGHVVIVDIKVNFNTKLPSPQAPNFAHFARVLGMDLRKQEIYIENTLGGAVYWTIPLETFFEAWLQPETSASLILDPAHAEDVTRWAVVIDRQVVQRDDTIRSNAAQPQGAGDKVND